MAPLAVLVAAAAFATPAPPGTYRCEPAVRHLPCGRGMVLRTRYRYDLYTGCGVIDAWFDGRRWLATPKPSDGSGNQPPGWSTPWQRGTITLVTRGRAIFRAARLTAHFRAAHSPEMSECNPRPVMPPPATVATAGGFSQLAWGSYCWSTPRSALCADMVLPDHRTDIPRLQVTAGETLTFHFGFHPTTVDLGVTGPAGQTLVDAQLTPTRTTTWPLPSGLLVPNTDLLATLFVRAANGEATYLFWLHA